MNPVKDYKLGFLDGYKAFMLGQEKHFFLDLEGDYRDKHNDLPQSMPYAKGYVEGFKRAQAYNK